MRFLWRPLPYSRLRECDFLNCIDENDSSSWIAALKIFICIVIKSDLDENGEYCAMITYPQVQKMTGMSRQLICCGFDKLKFYKMISSEGVRKKKYSLLTCEKGSTRQKPLTKRFDGLSTGRWCKFPLKGLIDDDGVIPSFLAMSNRNINDLHALRLFVYLLSVRRHGDVFIVVKAETLMKKLRLKRVQLTLALAHMSALGLIVKERYREGDFLSLNKTPAYAFLLCGWDALEWNHNRIKESNWRNDYLESFDNWV
ncbi:hypothetical protein [Klebsiella oxytoca]|uniref:hypothetical protein n=1 Tax=Klebsiella oxytoca TaxID=571 RepID=UPI000515EC6E|nr:hypothetical protein [Klebsiella oxytoca]